MVGGRATTGLSWTQQTRLMAVVTRIVIIGGGPAGYEAALVAAGHGPGVAQVTIVESDGIGGGCVLWDCVPSKTFIASTGVRTELRRADGLGFDIKIEDAKISLPQIHNRVKTLARSQSADIGSNLLREGVTIIHGRGELVDDSPGMAHHRVKVTTSDGKVGTLKADVVLIATGARPRVLPQAVPDGDRILNWRQLYDLTELPEHLVIVGSGVTGAEFCNAYTELGVQVTVVASRDQILPHEDLDAAAVLEETFAERGVKLVKNARAQSVTSTADGVVVAMADGRTVEGSHALMTVGSVPNTEGLGLEKVGIELNAGNYLRWTGFRAPLPPASTLPATVPGSSRWRRWPPCRAASRCITRSARGCRRFGCAPSRPPSSPAPRSPRSASRRPPSTTARCPRAR